MKYDSCLRILIDLY